MIRRLGIRLLQMAAVMLIMSLAVFALMAAMPGDPIDLMIAGNPHLTADDANRLRALYGVGQPWPVRWWDWLGQVIHGQLGYSRLFARPVAQMIWPALGHTAWLGLCAMALALGLGLPLGVAAGAGQADRIITGLSYLVLSVPTFWLGLMLIALFSVTLGWLPATGEAVLLPAFTLAAGGIGQYIRHMRAAMLTQSPAPYLRTARAKGCGPWRVVLAHQCRNALLPVVTVAALEAGSLLSGAVVTETVFAWPGLGRLTYDAIMGNDYNLALSALLMTTLLTLLASALADLAYGLLDPRIRPS